MNSTKGNAEEPDNEQQGLPQDGEISRDDALKSLLTDEELSDLTLRCSDGSLVDVNKCILASRSLVFRRMLFGRFAEASKSIVDVGYTGDVIRAMVEYIYTTDAQIFHQSKPYDNHRAVQTVVALVDAANYFALPILRRKTSDFVRSMIHESPPLAGEFLAACESRPQAADVENVSLQEIRARPEGLLQGNALAVLSASQLEKILQDDQLMAHESTRFAILHAWANAKDLALTSSGTATSKPSLVMESRLAVAGASNIASMVSNRKREAAQLTDYLRLDYIDPVELNTTVASSGLVTTEQLCNAYKEQALVARQQHGIVYKKSRLVPVWNSSQSSVFECQSRQHNVELLRCLAMKSGVHKWSIILEKDCGRDEWMGVASTASDTTLDMDDWLGDQAGGWVYGNSGYACHALGQNCAYQRKTHPQYRVGCKVTFLLDLTGDGTLSASVDGNPMVKLFGDMLPEDGEGSFVPAVSLKRPGRVRFLGFEAIPAKD